MSCEPQYTRIQLRRDTASDWTLNNPVLAEGEAGYEINTGKLKIGNGTTTWNLLSYFDDRTANWTDVQGRPVNLSQFNNDVGYLTIGDIPDSYVLPTASTTVLGGVKIDGTSITIIDGIISATAVNSLGNLEVVDQTISGTQANADIVLAPDGVGTVRVPSITLPVGGIMQETISLEIPIADLVLANLVAYSTNSNSIPQGTYGNTFGIPAPWAVYQFTTTPDPVLQTEDIIGGAGVPVGSAIQYVGTGPYSAYIVTDITITAAPPEPGATITIVRPLVNPALSINTPINTDIALITGGGTGVIVPHSDIIPFVTGEYSLGTPTKRFSQLWLSGASIFIFDEVTGTDISLSAENNQLVVEGGSGFRVGEFNFLGNTLTGTDPDANLVFGGPTATGAIEFNRPIEVNTLAGGLAFTVDRTGRASLRTPVIPAGDIGALSIIGNDTGSYQPVVNPGGMLHITGNDGAQSRITNDAFGTEAFPAYISRSGRGTAAAPTATQSGDILSRFATNGWGDTAISLTVASTSPTAIEVVARQTFTDSVGGTEYRFYTSPLNAVIKSLSLRVDSSGISFVNTTDTTAGITFRDSTRQTTAFTGTVAAANITGLGLVATSNNYSDLTGLPTLFSGVYADLTGKPDVVTSIGVTSGLSVGRVNGTVTLSNTGVISVAAAAGTGQIGVGLVGGAVTLTLPQGISTTSNVQFNDLTITGTLTATNFNIETAPTIAGKTLLLASDAIAASEIDNGGILLGPIGQPFSRSFLYDLANDRWSTNGSGLITQELNALDLTVIGRAHFGNAFVTYEFSNATIQSDGNADSYLQLVNKNHSDGVNASADIVATNDLGDDNGYYIDMGINSSNYANPDYSITGPSDGYVFINGGDLAVGTQTAATEIRFHTGGTTSDKLRATITDTGLVVVGTTSSTLFSGPLTGNVTGNVSGNAGTVTNGVYTTDIGTVTNTMLAGSIANNKLTNSAITINGTSISLGGTGTVTAAAGTLTGTTLASNILTSSLTSVGTLTNLTVTNAISGSITGNAGSVTNGIYTTGLYANPSWITSLAYSKLTGAPTVPTAVSQLTNDSGYITAGVLSVTSNIPSGSTSTLTYNAGVFTFTSAAASDGTVTSVSGTGTVSGLTLSGTVTTTGSLTLGGSLSLTSLQVTNGLGYTPYNQTNPAGYTSNAGTVTSVSGTGSVSGLTLSGTVTGSGNLTLGGSLSLTGSQVTTALGYTPLQTAVTSAVAGTGIGVSGATGAVTFTNTGVTSIVAGAGISISGATGAVTINSTAGSQNAIQTISVQGDGSFTATSPTSSVIFAPAGRMSLNIVGNVISITDNAKAHKVKKVKHKDLTFETDLEATAAEDTMTFVDGRGIRMTTDAVNQTITIAAEDTIRDAGATNAVTIDFAVDEVVLYQPTNTNAITLTNMSVGKKVTVYAKCSTNKVITHGALATSASLGAATITPVAGSLVKIEYFCTGSTQASVYATWVK